MEFKWVEFLDNITNTSRQFIMITISLSNDVSVAKETIEKYSVPQSKAKPQKVLLNYTCSVLKKYKILRSGSRTGKHHLVNYNFVINNEKIEIRNICKT